MKNNKDLYEHIQTDIKPDEENACIICGQEHDLNEEGETFDIIEEGIICVDCTLND